MALQVLMYTCDRAESCHCAPRHAAPLRDVEVVISTHAAGGLTQFDFVLAAKLDTVPIDYSPKWLRENPEPGAAPSTTQ